MGPAQQVNQPKETRHGITLLKQVQQCWGHGFRHQENSISNQKAKHRLGISGGGVERSGSLQNRPLQHTSRIKPQTNARRQSSTVEPRECARPITVRTYVQHLQLAAAPVGSPAHWINRSPAHS